MPDFSYIARDLSGDKVEGSMSANSEADVISRLSSKSLFPITVKNLEEAASA